MIKVDTRSNSPEYAMGCCTSWSSICSHIRAVSESTTLKARRWCESLSILNCHRRSYFDFTANLKLLMKWLLLITKFSIITYKFISYANAEGVRQNSQAFLCVLIAEENEINWIYQRMIGNIYYLNR